MQTTELVIIVKLIVSTLVYCLCVGDAEFVTNRGLHSESAISQITTFENNVQSGLNESIRGRFHFSVI